MAKGEGLFLGTLMRFPKFPALHVHFETYAADVVINAIAISVLLLVIFMSGGYIYT